MEHFFHNTVRGMKYAAMNYFPGNIIFIKITIDDWSHGEIDDALH